MNIFENIILSSIILLFPILCYLFYIVANKNIDEKSQKITLIFIILTIIYLIYKYYSNTIYSFLIFTIPLYIVYKKNYNVLVLLINISLLFLCYIYSPIYFIFFLLESIFIFFMVKDKLFYKYIIIVVSVNLFYIFIFDINKIMDDLIYLIIYILCSVIVCYTVTSGEEVINYHIEYSSL